MLPAPKGGSRLVRPTRRPGRYAGFNAARPEGRESATRHRSSRRAGRTRFNAARPEGRESDPATIAQIDLIIALQCCPPRRAGVGQGDPEDIRAAIEASMLPAPKGGSRQGRSTGRT